MPRAGWAVGGGCWTRAVRGCRARDAGTVAGKGREGTDAGLDDSLPGRSAGLRVVPASLMSPKACVGAPRATEDCTIERAPIAGEELPPGVSGAAASRGDGVPAELPRRPAPSPGCCWFGASGSGALGLGAPRRAGTTGPGESARADSVRIAWRSNACPPGDPSAGSVVPCCDCWTRWVTSCASSRRSSRDTSGAVPGAWITPERVKASALSARASASTAAPRRMGTDVGACPVVWATARRTSGGTGMRSLMPDAELGDGEGSCS